jgi:hypothetical protein
MKFRVPGSSNAEFGEAAAIEIVKKQISWLNASHFIKNLLTTTSVTRRFVNIGSCYPYAREMPSKFFVRG